jgi:hypothetical protein
VSRAPGDRNRWVAYLLREEACQRMASKLARWISEYSHTAVRIGQATGGATAPVGYEGGWHRPERAL